MRIRTAITVLTGLMMAVTSGVASAVDCTQPGNLVPNCGFVTDLSFWFFTADSATWVLNGASSPGAAVLNRHDGIGAIEAIGACFPVSSSTTYDLGASFLLSSGVVTTSCTLDVWMYTDTTCNSSDSDVSFGFIPNSGWTEVTDTLTPASGINSAVLRMACFSDSEFVLHVDDFLFASGFLDPEIFANGFESGNLSAWSLAIPYP